VRRRVVEQAVSRCADPGGGHNLAREGELLADLIEV
jgi:hypothetical protein